MLRPETLIETACEQTGLSDFGSDSFREGLAVLCESVSAETQLNAWFVAVGQDVKAGDDIAELVTDKAAFNLPASEAGKIVKLLVKEGATIKPGDRLAEIETGG